MFTSECPHYPRLLFSSFIYMHVHYFRKKIIFQIAHFQKEWQTGAKMGARSIMGSFGGAIARAKTFSLTQVKFQFNNEQKFKYCVTLKRMKILKQKGFKKPVPKSCYTKTQAFWHYFIAFLFQQLRSQGLSSSRPLERPWERGCLFQYFQSFSFSSSALA